MHRFLPLFLVAFAVICVSCRSIRRSVTDCTVTKSTLSVASDSLLRRLSARRLQRSDLDSRLVFVTVDPAVAATRTYDVTLPDGSTLTVPGNATGYGVRTEAARDTSSLVIDGRDYRSRMRYEGAAADATYSSAETTDYKPPAHGMLSSLRIILMTIGALAACAVVFYFRKSRS